MEQHGVEVMDLDLPDCINMMTDFIKNNTGVLALWETSRGCPFSCNYCSWGTGFLNRIKIHDMDKLKREIEFIARNKIREVHASDANFGLLPRDLDISLIK